MFGLRSEGPYDTDDGFPVSNPRANASRTHLLRRLADQVLEAPDVLGLTKVLTQALPAAVRVEGATLLVWDRKLDSFEGLSIAEDETQVRAFRPLAGSIPTPETHYLISDHQLIETPGGSGEGRSSP